MSTIGFPDGQRITQWLGAPFAQATALAIGNVLHTDGPYSVASWASVVVAVKATGGSVTVTLKQQVSGGPPGLELDQSFVVPAGGTTFEALVLFGNAVTLTMLGSAPGVTVDYALYPSNSTTNAQVLTQATIDVQHNDALVGAEAALDIVEGNGNGIGWTITDDGPNGRVKLTAAALGQNFPGVNLVANTDLAWTFGGGGITTLYMGALAAGSSLRSLGSSQPAGPGARVIIRCTGSFPIVIKNFGGGAQQQLFTLSGSDILLYPGQAVEFVQDNISGWIQVGSSNLVNRVEGFGAVFPGGNTAVTFGRAFSAIYAIAITGQTGVGIAPPISITGQTSTGFTMVNGSGGNMAIGWVAVGI